MIGEVSVVGKGVMWNLRQPRGNIPCSLQRVWNTATLPVVENYMPFGKTSPGILLSAETDRAPGPGAVMPLMVTLRDHIYDGSLLQVY